MKPQLAMLFAFAACLPAICLSQTQTPVVKNFSDGGFNGSPLPRPTVTKPTRLRSPQDANQFSLTPPVKQSRSQPLRPHQQGSSSTEALPPKKNKQVSSSSRPKSVVLETCFAKLIDDIELPAEESGKLTKITVQPGARVSKDQLVAQMDDQRSQMMREEAGIRYRSASRLAGDDTEIRSAQKKLSLARREFEDTRTLYQKGSESKQAYQRAKYSMQIADLELVAAKNQKSMAALDAASAQVQVNAANASIRRNRIQSPVDGIVFEVFKDGGEWATAGEKIMRIARMDRLRIQGYVEGNQFDPHEVANKPVTVTLELATESIDFTGQIVFVSPEKKANRYQVWAEVNNVERNGRWVLQSDHEVAMTIHLDRNASSITRKRNPRQPFPR